MPVQYWLNLEMLYQETRARLSEELALQKDLMWLKRFPLNDMIKKGWLAKHKDDKAQLVALLEYLGIAGVAQWSKLWRHELQVAYRQHTTHEIHEEAVSAWLRRGEIEAAGIACEPYDKGRFRAALDEVRGLTMCAPSEFVPKMQACCARAGVAVVFVPALPKTGVSGATRWLSTSKALIQLSLRYKSNDHLWFTFFHEAGHILLHGKKELFLEGLNGLDAEKEREANAFAERELIPPQVFANWVNDTPRLTKSAIVEFAAAIRMAPGVVVGQLQHKGYLPMTHCNDLKLKYEWTTQGLSR
jgi:HTH-type transcriptional regulator/antitoxin HigA